MATKRAKMAPQPSTLDSLIASGVRYQPLGDQAQESPPEPTSLTRRILGDGGISLLKGAVGVPEAAVGLADLVTGGRVGKALEEGVNVGGVNIGFRPKMAKEALDQMLTPEQQKANQEVQQAQGFLDTTIAALQNPSTILHASAESLPVMGAGGVIGRALMAGTMRAAPALAGRIAAAEAAPLVASQGAQTAAKYAPVLAGAAGEGVTTMGSQAESIRQETPDGLLTGEQSALAAGSGFITGGLSVLGGAIAAKLGIHDIDTLLAGKHSPEVTKGFTRRVLEGAVSEGLLEELPQSVQEQVAQNLALGKPLGEGVNQAAVLGMFSGGLMGGASNAPGHGKPKSVASAVRDEKQPETGPVARAANAGLEATAQQAESIEAAAAQPAEPTAPQAVDPGAAPTADQPMPAPAAAMAPVAAPVQDAAPAEAAPAANLGAFEQRQADKPAEPTAAPMPGERVLTTMDTAMRVKARAGEGAEIVPVVGGVVVRKVDSETGELVPTAAPAAAPELPGVEAAPPAPPPAAALPDDVLNPQGKPFTHRGAAAIKMRKLGDGYTIAPVEGGFAVRKLAAVAAPVDESAHAAATSPNNDRPEPTQAQKEAGNYAKGHHTLAGLDLSIENPAGSVRRGTDKNGKAWENTLQHHYGYIKGTIGNDKDHVDAFVKPGTPDDWDGTVFVIDQVHPETGKFDEHKALLGFDSKIEARDAYDANYAADWKGGKHMTAMPAAEFRAWVKDGPKNKPLAADQMTGKQQPVVAPEVSTPAPDANQEPSKKETLPAVKQQLFVEGPDGKKYPVADIPEAQAKWEEFRDATGEGVSQVGNGVRILDQGGKFVARVSYNGRVWDTEDAPPAPPKSAVAGPTQSPVWDSAKADEREQYLLKAGWHKGSPGTEAMKTKAWDQLTTNQKARIRAAMDGQAAPAPAPVNAPAPAENAAAPAPGSRVTNPDGSYYTVPKEAKPRKPSAAAQRASEAREQKRADYFTPGNVVAGYGGFDEVLEYRAPSADGRNWAVKVHGVIKSQGSGQWVRVGKPQDARWHSTEPEARHVAYGPVARLTYQPSDQVSYTEGRADGKPFPNAPDRGVKPADAPAPKAEKAEMRPYRREDGSIGYEAVPIASPAPAAEQPTRVVYEGKGGQVFDQEAIFRANRNGVKLGDTAAEALGQNAGAFEQALQREAVAAFDAQGNFIADKYRFVPKGKNGSGIRTFNDLAEAKAFADSYGQKSTPPAEPRKRIGKGDRGQTIFENEQGLRSYTESGFKYEEQPGKPREDSFKTTEELAAAAPAAAAPAVSANTIFTEDAAANAREVLKRKLGNLNTGIDPELLQAGITLAGYHIEKGARTFAAYARAMVSDLGDGIKPYLQSWYMAVRSDPRAAEFKTSMDKASAVEDLTAAEIDAMVAPQAEAAPESQPKPETEAAPQAEASQPERANTPVRDEAQIELRKRLSVLESLRRCIG